LCRRPFQARRSLRDLAEEKYQFTSLRESKAKEAQEARERQLVAEAEARVRSELNIPTPRPGIPRAAIFSGDKTLETSPGAGVAAAIAAFNEGKYRPDQ
jgi:hypothetical protein